MSLIAIAAAFHEKNRGRILRYLTVAATGVLFAASIFGQAPTGTLQGRVADPNGSAIPGAKITIEKGRVVQGNFDDYAPLRMEETPAVEVYSVPSAESPTGIGEPSVPPVAPALCNAIYAATKKRIRALPILS